MFEPLSGGWNAGQGREENYPPRGWVCGVCFFKKMQGKAKIKAKQLNKVIMEAFHWLAHGIVFTTAKCTLANQTLLSKKSRAGTLHT